MIKRILALLVLTGAVAGLLKVGLKPSPPRLDHQSDELIISGDVSESAQVDSFQELRERYPDPADAELVDRVINRFGNNALTIEATDGFRGLKLLDQFDLEAIVLYEESPDQFRRLVTLVDDQAAAELLLNWREYFSLKRSDQNDRERLINEIARLSVHERRLASEYPSALPLILSAPGPMTELIERFEDDPERLRDALTILTFIDLEPGAFDLREGIRTLNRFPGLAIEGFRNQGLEGFATVHRFGSVLKPLRGSMPVEDAIIVARVNWTYLEERLRVRSPESVAAEIRHVGALGLTEEVAGTPDGLRLVGDYGSQGETALRKVGPDAAQIVYQLIPQGELQTLSVEAMAIHGRSAAALLSKYADNNAFLTILGRDGPAIIPPIARADFSPELLAELRAKPDRTPMESLAFALTAISGESGQKTIDLIRRDGLSRAMELNDSEIAYYEFLPLYDIIHLGHVVTRGNTPTSTEYAWALVDGAFIIADLISIATFQPEGVAASELARSEAKALTKNAAKRFGKEATEETVESVARKTGIGVAENGTERASRWASVQASGGLFQLLRQTPEALRQLDLKTMTRMARPVFEKAGLKMSSWVPMRFVQGGRAVIKRFPPERWTKYLVFEATQAGVGVLAIKKMEEHLGSDSASTSTSY